jgi:hypothetical protein
MQSEEPENVLLGRVARSALADAESRLRKEQFNAAQERNKLRAEIRDLKERKSARSGDGSSMPAAKRPRHEAPEVQAPAHMGPTEAYTMYHAAEAALREEREKVGSLEASLDRVVTEMQQRLPVYKERSARLAVCLESNEDLSKRLSVAVSERDEAKKTAEQMLIEVAALRATLDEAADGSDVRKTELELREELRREQLSAEARVADVVRPLKEKLLAAEEQAQADRAEGERTVVLLSEMRQEAGRWRVLYEASVAATVGESAGGTAPAGGIEARALAEVKDLLTQGVTGVAKAKIDSLEAQLSEARGQAGGDQPQKPSGQAAEAAKELQTKLAASEASVEKLRKAAAHWKTQFTKLKEQTGAPGTPGAPSTPINLSTDAPHGAEVSRLNERVSALEADLKTATEGKDAAETAAARSTERLT